MKTAEIVRRCALALPDVDEGIACAGTPLEKSTYRARKKAFVFFGPTGDTFELMLKLRESIDDARALAAKEPHRYKVGASGWTTVKLAGAAPPKGLIERWIAESHRLAVGTGDAKKTAKKTATKKKTAKKTATK